LELQKRRKISKICIATSVVLFELVGIKFVQFQKNLSYHSGIKRTPYKAMLGVEAKAGLTSSSLRDEKYPKSVSLHQSFFLISMATEQQILSYYLGKP
jgi:hypothetical protein